MATNNDQQVSEDRRLNFLEEYYFNLDEDPKSFEDLMVQLRTEAEQIWDRMQD